MGNVGLDSTWLQIGNRRQFFFDNLMVEQAQDVTRRYHRPRRVADKPLIRADQPWEHITYFSTNTWSLVRDPRDGLFRCWYEDYCVGDLTKVPTWINESDGKLCVDFHGQFGSRMCLAVSEDGLSWRKPAWGIVEESGHDTNIVLGGAHHGYVHCPYVLLDEADPDPGRRYKVMFEHRRVEGGDDMAGAGAFRAAFSPDGKAWEVWEKPIRFGQVGEVLGDVITVTRDPESGIYWTNNRHAHMCSSSIQDRRKPVQPSWICPVYPHRVAQENRRRVFRSSSHDFCTWTTPQPLVAPDHEDDNIDDAFYGMEQFQIGDDWIGLLTVFHHTDNFLDVQLTYSRDGCNFTRVQPGRPFLSPHGGDSWDSTEVSTCSKPVLVGDELYIYYGGARCHHDWWITGSHEGLDVPEAHDLSNVGYCLGLAKMKRDRFVSIASAEAREGLFVTPGVFPRGRRLVLNARTRPGGAVRVALADGQDAVIDGYSKDDCVALTGDHVDNEVRWSGRTGRPEANFLKLHFYLKDADLFSFQFVE